MRACAATTDREGHELWHRRIEAMVVVVAEVMVGVVIVVVVAVDALFIVSVGVQLRSLLWSLQRHELQMRMLFPWVCALVGRQCGHLFEHTYDSIYICSHL